MPRVTQTCDRAAALASFLPGDQIARILSAGGALQIEIYDVPVANGSVDAVAGLRDTMTTAQAAGQPAYASLVKLRVGSICRSKARTYSRTDPLRSLARRGHTLLSHCSE